MKFQDYAFVGLLIVAIAFVAQSFGPSTSSAALQEVPQAQEEAIASGTLEYARLIVAGNNQVTWITGGDANPRTETIRSLFGRLDGRGTGTFGDLLDQLGANRWRLIQVNDTVWIFSRAARNE